MVLLLLFWFINNLCRRRWWCWNDTGSTLALVELAAVEMRHSVSNNTNTGVTQLPSRWRGGGGNRPNTAPAAGGGVTGGSGIVIVRYAA
jgi:hypothetical protein